MPAGSPWRRRLLALAISLGISFLMGEIFVRLVVGSPLSERLPVLHMRANEHRGWEMVEGVHYTYYHPAFVNSLGLRNPEVAPRQPNEVRVLMLGDSLVYGQGVGDDETLPFALQEVCEASDADERSWTVINSGHRAYDTRQELGLLDQLGSELDPDIVVMCWYWNDLAEREIERMYQRIRGRGELAFDTGSRIEGWAKVQWWSHELLRRSALTMYLHDLVDRSQAENMSPAVIEAGLAKLAAYLERFVARCDELGARPLFCVIPDPGALLGPHASTDVVDRALRMAQEQGIPTVHPASGLEAYFQENGRLPVIPFDGHYLSEGNRIMAEDMAPELFRSIGALQD